MNTFYTTSDDGSSLYIDDVLVVSNDSLHAATEKSGVIGVNYKNSNKSSIKKFELWLLAVTEDGRGFQAIGTLFLFGNLHHNLHPIITALVGRKCIYAYNSRK